MSRPQSRRVRIVLQGRSESDPRAILHAVKEAFNPHDIEIVAGVPLPPSNADPGVPDELLETEATRKVQRELDEKAAKTDAKARELPARDGRPPPAPASEIIGWRKRIWIWMKGLAGRGYSVTVREVSRGATEAILEHHDQV